ncbi:MAG: hypothetical protein COB76_06495, partial [Alphaproteobacteria bacterium]
MLKRLQLLAKHIIQRPHDRIERALNIPAPIQSAKSVEAQHHVLHACPSYTELRTEFRNVGRMNAIIETLGRDFLTAMPDGAYVSRLGQIAFLYRRQHEDLATDKVIDLLGNAKEHLKNNPSDWDEWNTANLREMESSIRHHAGVPADLIEKRARL